MDEVITINGKIISKGSAKGSALVCPVSVSFYGGINCDTALVTDIHSPMYNENVTGKIMVFPTGKSSTGTSWILYTMGNRGTAPAAIINTELDPILVMGAICGNVPMVHVTEVNPMEVISPGDLVEINGESGVITITKK